MAAPSVARAARKCSSIFVVSRPRAAEHAPCDPCQVLAPKIIERGVGVQTRRVMQRRDITTDHASRDPRNSVSSSVRHKPAVVLRQGLFMVLRH